MNVFAPLGLSQSPFPNFTINNLQQLLQFNLPDFDHNSYQTMGKTQLALLAILAIAAVSLYTINTTDNSVENHSFDAWKLKFSKNYSPKEQSYRISIWLQNLAYVEAHNKRFQAGLQTFDLEMNQFADLDTAQFKQKYLISFPEQATSKCTGPQPSTANIPTEIDWSAQGAVTAIKNQGQCGSCWAFSSTGSIEGLYFRTKGTLKSFSEQQLVDCSKSYGNQGCNGGWMNASFFYVKDSGITTEDKYPYHGVGSTCKYTEADKVFTVSDCTEVAADKEASLEAAVAKGPVSVAIEANHISFQLYKSGVYSGNCGTKLDHGVLAVGYGEISGKKHFKVKNSWGNTWGDKGFIYIAREGDGKGKCGIYMAASYPIA